MPVTLRGLPDDLAARIRRYAEAKRLDEPTAVMTLLTAALDSYDARSAASRARWRKTPKAARIAEASRLAATRWQKHQETEC